MLLSECEAYFWGTLGGRNGMGLLFYCPLCIKAGLPEEQRTLIPVPFKNPIDGGPQENRPGVPHWQRTGDTIDVLTLSPSVDSSRSPNGPNPLHHGGHMGWHGHIENGEIKGGI